MPFIAPVIAGIGSAIGAGGLASLGGAALGGALGGFGGQSGAQKAATGNIKDIVSALQTQSSAFSPYASKFMNMSLGAYPQALNFWGGLLSPSRTTGMSVLAPQMAQIDEQQNALLQATKGSRTGAGASIYAAAPYEAAEQKQNMAANLRGQAGTQMGTLGSQTGQLGTQSLYAIISSLGQALGGSEQLRNQANSAYGQSQAAGKEWGTIMADVLKGIWG